MTTVATHWSRFDELPRFLRVLLLWSADSAKEAGSGERIAVLEIERGKMVIVSTREALCSSDWFHFLERFNREGFKLIETATADLAVFSMLEYGVTENRSSSEEDAKVIAEIIADSRPLTHFKQLIGEVIDLGASDIHVEVRGDVAQVKVRVDGVIRRKGAYPARLLEDSLSTGFTVLAEELSRSDAAFNARLAQAAMIPIEHAGEQFTLRYQSHPAVGGFDTVLRILRTSKGGSSARVRSLSQLGYLPGQAELLELALSSAWGGIFIAGITGSGKTTTLNSMLDTLARQGGKKIISIEDPVEYVVDDVSHLSIQRSNASVGQENPFLNAMRAFLRLDPDVGMFGEIRDQISGEIAQAAIETGHKILTTVHATSSIGIVSRLTSRMIGLDRETVCNPEFLSSLVYQVLLPRNCTHCRRPATEVLATDELIAYEHIFGLDASRFMCASDQGCDHCRVTGLDYSRGEHQGTSGVKVAAEVILPDNALLSLLLERRDIEAREYSRRLRRSGFDSNDMVGKEAWGHALYDVSLGEVDPYYFRTTFGHPKSFLKIMSIA